MTQTDDNRNPIGVREIRLMRLASVLEATTLTLLVFVAMPLKHIAGLPHMSAVMGPVHGVAFLFFCWALMQFATAGGGKAWTVMRLLAFSFIPLAGFVNERWLRQEQTRLSTPPN